MITDPTSTGVPKEILENIDSVHARVEKVSQELSQALTVWGSTLSQEKEQFESLLSRKELAAQEQDELWARQCKVFEERLSEMKFEFETRLQQAEQNAARSLTELDDAWQRDKLDWGPEAQSQWPLQRRQLEAKVQALEVKLSQLEAEQQAPKPIDPSQETIRALEGQLQEFQSTVAELQNRTSKSDKLVYACVQALDYQISVLSDLIYHHAEPQTATES